MATPFLSVTFDGQALDPLVRSVTVGTTSIQARTTPGSFGFVSDDSTVFIDGWRWDAFCKGVQNVTVVYDAGYQTSDAVTVPSGTPYTVNATSGLSHMWNTDRGVSYTGGSAFTLVSVSPTAAGTYQLTTDNQANTVYNFAAADANEAVTITYGYTPDDLAQALLELAGERQKSRSRIGENSQNIGHGQVVAFSQKDMGASVKTLLNPYRNVVPVQ